MNSTPAFPVSTDFGTRVESAPGMTLRDYFAAKAMQTLVTENNAGVSLDVIADTAYLFADAMLAARGE